jgi:uncharacterized protein
MKKNEQFRRGVVLFNARKFFEAHEVWEEIWLAEREPEKTFLQGLIQLAAAFYHHGRGNSRGTKSLLTAGLSKLAGFPETHRGIAVADLRADATKWTEKLPAGEHPGAPKLPRIRRAARAIGKRKRRG